MEKCKQILKKIFFLPPIPTFLLALFGYALVIFVFAAEVDIPAIQYLAYTSSAYALVITITGFPHWIAFVRGIERYISGHSLMKKLKSTYVGGRFLNDVRFRTEVSLYWGLLINVLYIAIKLYSGIRYRSPWFISLAIYYILLVVMRLLLLRKEKRKTGRSPAETEVHRYRLCGIMLLFMNQALAGIVIFIVRQNKGFDYPGVLIYAMAFYSFYAVITAVINLVKFRKHGSPVLSAAKVINLVAAMVSILSLTTAMISQFGDGDTVFRKTMTGAVGGGVCTIVIGMAIFMIGKSRWQMKK